MIKVYLSGPIAHYDLEERKKTFKTAAEKLTNYGFEVVNPFDNGVDQGAHWHDHMKADISLLLNCDIICLLPDWYKSKGCKLELDVASSCGLVVMTWWDNSVINI